VPGQVQGFQVGEVVDKPVEPSREEFKFRYISFEPTRELLDSARALTTDRVDLDRWQETAFNRSKHEDTNLWRMSRPNVHIGEKEWLASGNFAVKTRVFAQSITSEYPLVRAVDMEALGLYEALQHFGSSAPSRLLVRGISDYADSQKIQLDTSSDGRYRRAATRSAAQFTVDLVIRRMRLNEAITSEQLRFSPKLRKLARAELREHGLVPWGQGSLSCVIDPLIDAARGMSEISELVVEVKNGGEGDGQHSIALRQRKAEWTRYLEARVDSGKWTWAIGRSADPYALSLAFVGDAGLEFSVYAKDEFGREARLASEDINGLYGHTLG
jgi:hypothetical protein